MAEFKDLTGVRVGRLTVIGLTDRGSNGRIRWLCKCDCGNETKVLSTSLICNRTKSCGCLAKEMIGTRARKHGQYKSRLYKIWGDMLSRCRNPKSDGYYLYGAKGISVCDEWKDFQKFRDWAMANGYADNLSIDRKDGSKGYSPDNCRWATPQEQTDNRECCRYIEYGGKRQTIKAWSKDTGINYQTLRNRLNKGWSIEKALTEKPKCTRRKKR